MLIIASLQNKESLATILPTWLANKSLFTILPHIVYNRHLTAESDINKSTWLLPTYMHFQANHGRYIIFFLAREILDFFA